MTETATPRQRSGGRDARRAARLHAVVEREPFLTRTMAPFEVLGEEGLSIIEHNADTILEEVGLEFRGDSEALRVLKDAGADACGIAIASTKCSWNRGSTAVSIFSTVLATSSISRRAARLTSAISAPVPAALPAALTWLSSASGMSPRTIAWNGSIWLPKAPARRTSSTASMPAWSMSSRTPA